MKFCASIFYSFEQMKKSLLPILLFISSLLAAQTVVEVSNPSKLPAKTGKFKVIGKNNDGIVLRLFGSTDVIDVFDNELKLVTSKTIEFKNQDGLLQHVMLNKTGAVIFYLQQDRKYSVLYAQPVNSKFIETGKPVLIDSILDRKELVASNLRFKTSPDQSQLMIYYPFFSMGKVDVIKFMCVDRALNLFYNKIVPVSRDEKELEYSKAFIDNNGNSFLILKPESSGNGSSYEVIHLNNKGDFNTYTISTDKEIFGEPWFELDNKNGNLVMTAFYDDHSKAGEPAANGILFNSFDPANGTTVSVNYSPFTKPFIAELTGRENPTNLSLYTFNIRKSILRNDGGMLLVAESFIKDSRDQIVPIGIQPGYNSYRTAEVFQFNDIITFSINPRGQIEWSSIMRKKQSSEDDNGAFSSFITMNEKEQLRFVYLDEVASTGSLYNYVLSSTGQNTRDVLLNQEERDLLLLPKMGKQISPNELIIPSFKNGALRLVKIAF